MSTPHHHPSSLQRFIAISLLALPCAHGQQTTATASTKTVGKASAPAPAKWTDPNAGLSLTTTTAPTQTANKGKALSTVRSRPMQGAKPCVPAGIKIKDPKQKHCPP